ncbi:hypothetical protein [Caproicibacter sp.]|uniref:hypothetical protein n=1 Tax=Caproicibacter sp. TaxID=2814884 RepID=UPI0039890700
MLKKSEPVALQHNHAVPQIGFCHGTEYHAEQAVKERIIAAVSARDNILSLISSPFFMKYENVFIVNLKGFYR